LKTKLRASRELIAACTGARCYFKLVSRASIVCLSAKNCILRISCAQHQHFQGRSQIRMSGTEAKQGKDLNVPFRCFLSRLTILAWRSIFDLPRLNNFIETLSKSQYSRHENVL
jgi:hypothetical protein